MTDAPGVEVTFCGERFEVADKVGLMPLMRFAKVAQGGADAADLEGLAAIYDLLAQCFTAQDWLRFQDVATEHKADADELLAVVPLVFEAMTARPTSRPSDSSGGPATTSATSTAGSSPALELLQGRPDLAVAIKRREGALSA